jgi:carboxymethylenebutenolidase
MSVAGLKRSGMIDMEPNVTLVQQYPAHEAVPPAGPSPVLLVLHDVYGLSPGIRAVASRFAREGFYSLAPNLYAHPFSVAAGAPAWMSHPMSVAGDPEWEGFAVGSSFRVAEGAEARAAAADLSRDRAREIVERALGYADGMSDADPSRVGVIGFGMGGRFAFRAACQFPDRIGAVVAWSPTALATPYPTRAAETMPILEFESLRAPALLFYGEQDGRARPGEREAVERVLASAGKNHEIVVLPEAGGEFFTEESPDYRIRACRAAWERSLAFLRESLPGRPAGN